LTCLTDAFSNVAWLSTLIVTLDFATPYISLRRTPLRLQVGMQVVLHVPSVLPKENWFLYSAELLSLDFATLGEFAHG
jgi:hypothetical protein